MFYKERTSQRHLLGGNKCRLKEKQRTSPVSLQRTPRAIVCRTTQTVSLITLGVPIILGTLPFPPGGAPPARRLAFFFGFPPPFCPFQLPRIFFFLNFLYMQLIISNDFFFFFFSFNTSLLTHNYKTERTKQISSTSTFYEWVTGRKTTKSILERSTRKTTSYWNPVDERRIPIGRKVERETYINRRILSSRLILHSAVVYGSPRFILISHSLYTLSSCLDVVKAER